MGPALAGRAHGDAHHMCRNDFANVSCSMQSRAYLHGPGHGGRATPPACNRERRSAGCCARCLAARCSHPTTAERAASTPPSQGCVVAAAILHAPRYLLRDQTTCPHSAERPFHEWVPRIRALLQLTRPLWTWRRAGPDRRTGYIQAAVQEQLLEAVRSMDQELELDITMYGDYHRG
jgi:hypothetical protein